LFAVVAGWQQIQEINFIATSFYIAAAAATLIWGITRLWCMPACFQQIALECDCYQSIDAQYIKEKQDAC
jgi:hypothetical protein